MLLVTDEDIKTIVDKVKQYLNCDNVRKEKPIDNVIKYCEDCIYCKPTGIFKKFYKYAKCFCPELQRGEGNVSSKISDEYCSSNREYGGCEKEAKYFRPRRTKEYLQVWREHEYTR